MEALMSARLQMCITPLKKKWWKSLRVAALVWWMDFNLINTILDHHHGYLNMHCYQKFILHVLMGHHNEHEFICWHWIRAFLSIQLQGLHQVMKMAKKITCMQFAREIVFYILDFLLLKKFRNNWRWSKFLLNSKTSFYFPILLQILLHLRGWWVAIKVVYRKLWVRGLSDVSAAENNVSAEYKALHRKTHNIA